MQKKLKYIFILMGLLLFSGCNIVIQDSVFDQNEFLGNEQNDPAIYDGVSDGSFISPFQINVDNNGLGDMERLLLWKFKANYNYKSVEMQTLSINGTKGFLVLLYMANRDQVDVYHSPGLKPNYNVYKAMLNECVITEADFEYRFKVDSLGLDAYLQLTDRFGNDIECCARERHPDRNYVNLLAPIGGESNEPDFLPIVFLKQFRLLAREQTELWVRINDQPCKMSKFPAKMNGEKIFFSKYSLEPVNSSWNAEYDGELPILLTEDKSSYVEADTRIALHYQNGHPEIEKFSGLRNGHETCFTFSPPIADLLHLQNGVELFGKFALSIDNIDGIIGGIYNIQRIDEKVLLNIQPTLGYSPVPGKAWMKKMQWQAELTVMPKRVQMISEWSKH